MTALLSTHPPRRTGRWFLAAGLALLGLGGAQAQVTDYALNYTTAGASSVAGTYADLGTAGTAIATPDTDDANSAPQNIGFTFNYDGLAFTQFVLNTNGFIKLGAATPSFPNLFYCNVGNCTLPDPVSSFNQANVDLIIPLNLDLEAGNGAGGAEYRVATTGTAPNRVCTIQWKNLRDKAGAAPAVGQFENLSFQAKLYENGNVEFVYGTFAPTTAPAGNLFTVVGLKGKGQVGLQTVLATKPNPADPWTAPGFITGNYVTVTHNLGNAAPPDAGRTYCFLAPANDVAVAGVYPLGKVAAALSSPVTVRVLVANTGTVAKTNVPVTLTVSGATTFSATQTVPNLPARAVDFLTFTYPVSATGTNTLTVRLPADDLPGNDVQTRTQAVTVDQLSHVQGTGFARGIGGVSVGSVLATRYQTTGPGFVTGVTPTFFGAAPASNYEVVVYDATGPNGGPGAVLYTSPARQRPAAGGPDPAALPGVPVNGAFYVAVRSLTANNLLLSYEVESPLRGRTFYYSPDGVDWYDQADYTIPCRWAMDATVVIRLAARTQLGRGELSVAPNPARGAAVLHLPAVAGARTARVVVLNGLGQVVHAFDAPLQAAGTRVPLDLAGLAPGLYTAQVQAGSETAAVRLTVE